VTDRDDERVAEVVAIDRDVWKNIKVTPDAAWLASYLSNVLDMQPADVAWAGKTLARIRAIAATSMIGHGVDLDPLRYVVVAAYGGGNHSRVNGLKGFGGRS
jgi:hypothetical protein